MSLHPTEDHVVVAPIESESVSPGGIVLPDNAKRRSGRGEIVAVGPGRHDHDGCLVPMPVSVGQTVIHQEYAGNEVKDGGKTFLIMRSSDIMAVVD